jgi:hypothetical protein
MWLNEGGFPMEKEKLNIKTEQDDKNPKSNVPESDLPLCDYAPEWAEHARFYREDEACDDGRMGGRPCSFENEECPVTDNSPTEDVEKL